MVIKEGGINLHIKFMDKNNLVNKDDNIHK